MTAINWGLLSPALNRNYAGEVQSAFESGRKLRDERDMRNALTDYNRSKSETALRYIAARNPELAAKLEDRTRDHAAGNALANVVGGAGMYMGGGSPAPVGNALSPYTAGQPAPAAAPQGRNDPSPVPMNPSPAPEMGASQQPAPQVGAVSPALRELARYDRETFFKVMQMGREERKAAADQLTLQLDIGGRLAQAISQLPPEQQDAAYQRERVRLESSGVIDLPDQWDPAMAQQRLTMGMKVLDALQEDRQEREFGYRQEEDARDNARDERRVRATERNTDSLIGYREDQVGLSRDRLEQAESDVVGSTVNARGETVVLRRDGTTTTLRHSRDPRGQGKGGRSGGRGDLIGPIQTNGRGQRIQYSKSKQAYVDLATGQVIK